MSVCVWDIGKGASSGTSIRIVNMLCTYADMWIVIARNSL